MFFRKSSWWCIHKKTVYDQTIELAQIWRGNVNIYNFSKRDIKMLMSIVDFHYSVTPKVFQKLVLLILLLILDCFLMELICVYYSILWPIFMWYTGMWSLDGDQSGQCRSTSLLSQWLLIMTSKWIMTLLGMCIVKLQWVVMFLGTTIVMAQRVIVMMVLCVHIMASQRIITSLWTFAIVYSLLYA